MSFIKNLLMILVVVFLVTGLYGCKKEVPTDRSSKNIDKAMEDAKVVDTLQQQDHEKIERSENPFTKARSNLSSEGKMTNPFVSPDNGNSADMPADFKSIPNPFKKIENPDSE